MPWIPVIGLVSPEESILFKKLVDTSNCSNNEKSTISNNNIESCVAQSEDEKDSADYELIDRRSNKEDREMKDLSDEIDTTDSENKGQTISDDLNDEDFIEIFNSSILLQKVMQLWREALNQRAELLARRSEVRRLFISYISLMKLDTKFRQIYSLLEYEIEINFDNSI